MLAIKAFSNGNNSSGSSKRQYCPSNGRARDTCRQLGRICNISEVVEWGSRIYLQEFESHQPGLRRLSVGI